jgi:gamma-glutamyltranspeptidase
VPGTIDAIVTLLKLYGTKSFEEVVQPTLAILDAWRSQLVYRYRQRAEDRNRRALAGGYGCDLSQID